MFGMRLGRWWNRIRCSPFHIDVYMRYGSPVSPSILKRHNPMASRSTRSGGHGSFSEGYGTTVSRSVGSRTCKLRGAFDGLGCRDGWYLRVECEWTCQRGKNRPHAQHSCYRGLLHVDPLFAERSSSAAAVKPYAAAPCSALYDAHLSCSFLWWSAQSRR